MFSELFGFAELHAFHPASRRLYKLLKGGVFLPIKRK
jgi:hypothetical protein